MTVLAIHLKTTTYYLRKCIKEFGGKSLLLLYMQHTLYVCSVYV